MLGENKILFFKMDHHVLTYVMNYRMNTFMNNIMLYEHASTIPSDCALI